MQFPDLPILTLGLTSVFRDCGLTRSQAKVLNREPFSQMSTFPCEIVTCQLDDADPLQVLCKYSNGASYEGFHPQSHKGGVPYEAFVYSQVLQPLSISKPIFYGEYKDINSSRIWLVMEYMKGAASLDIPQNEFLMRRAARWIGKFHAQCESFLSSILFRDEYVYPVDWESAAIGIGEIDLAFLTQFYPRQIVLEWEDEYKQARWPDGTPPEFEKRLAIARLYNAFRWLGDRQYGDNSDRNSRHWLFEEIRIHSERLGII